MRNVFSEKWEAVLDGKSWFVATCPVSKRMEGRYWIIEAIQSCPGDEVGTGESIARHICELHNAELARKAAQPNKPEPETPKSQPEEMTLRDRFAIEGMKGIFLENQQLNDADIAKSAYHMADAMLAERAKR